MYFKNVAHITTVLLNAASVHMLSYMPVFLSFVGICLLDMKNCIYSLSLLIMSFAFMWLIRLVAFCFIIVNKICGSWSINSSMPSRRNVSVERQTDRLFPYGSKD